MTAQGALAALKAHLAKRGFGDIEVNMTGGYDPTTHARGCGAHSRAGGGVSARRDRADSAGRGWRGRGRGTYLRASRCDLPAGHFGLGHGNGAHAPDEYYVIESGNPKVQGEMDPIGWTKFRPFLDGVAG